MLFTFKINSDVPNKYTMEQRGEIWETPFPFPPKGEKQQGKKEKENTTGLLLV
jgi:hypothetical protein